MQDINRIPMNLTKKTITSNSRQSLCILSSLQGILKGLFSVRCCYGWLQWLLLIFALPTCKFYYLS